MEADFIDTRRLLEVLINVVIIVKLNCILVMTTLNIKNDSSANKIKLLPNLTKFQNRFYKKKRFFYLQPF